MTFQFISDTVIFLLKYVKYLIIINNQSLNYGVLNAKNWCCIWMKWRRIACRDTGPRLTLAPPLMWVVHILHHSVAG